MRRGEHVVGVQEADNVAAGEGDPLVERVVDATIRFADELRVLVRELAQDAERAIGRSGIDDDMLDLWVCLRLET